MQLRRTFIHAAGNLSVFLGKSCGVFYLAAIGLSVYEVFTRYALNAPTVWTTEAVMAMCGTAWLLSAGAVTQQHRHITVTVMELVVGPRVWARMRRIAILLSLVAILGLLWVNWGPFLRATTHMERSGSAFNPPLPSYLKVMIVVTLVVYAMQLIANFLHREDLAHDHGTSHMDLPSDVKD